MVAQLLKGYIQSFGLDADDVPKVIGTFACLKYGTWCAGILVGIRYQPLRRLFLARSALTVAHPWAQRQKLRVLDAWDRAQRHRLFSHLASSPGQQLVHPRRSVTAVGRKIAQKKCADGLCTQGALEIRPASKTALAKFSTEKTSLGQRRSGETRRRINGHWKKALAAARANYSKAESRAKAMTAAFFAGWRSRSRKLLLYKQLVQRQHCRSSQLRDVRNPWLRWASKKYWHCRDKLEAKVESLSDRSAAWRYATAHLGLQPKSVALGFAEGTILFKVTSPLTLPFMLWLTVNFFKRQKLPGFSVTTPATCEDFESSLLRGDSDTEGH